MTAGGKSIGLSARRRPTDKQIAALRLLPDSELLELALSSARAMLERAKLARAAARRFASRSFRGAHVRAFLTTYEVVGALLDAVVRAGLCEVAAIDVRRLTGEMRCRGCGRTWETRPPFWVDDDVCGFCKESDTEPHTLIERWYRIEVRGVVFLWPAAAASRAIRMIGDGDIGPRTLWDELGAHVWAPGLTHEAQRHCIQAATRRVLTTAGAVGVIEARP